MQLNSVKYNICPSVRQLVHLITASMKSSFLFSICFQLVCFAFEDMMAAGLGDHLVFPSGERHGEILGNTKTLEAVIHPLRSY